MHSALKRLDYPLWGIHFKAFVDALVRIAKKFRSVS